MRQVRQLGTHPSVPAGRAPVAKLPWCATRDGSSWLPSTVLAFHGLRHTCGAWLGMAGAHPKAVQAIMRYSIIVLTMDTYGHLFPGQEAETISRLPAMMVARTLATRSSRRLRTG